MKTAIFLQYHKVTNRFEMGGTWTPVSFFKKHVEVVKLRRLKSLTRDELKNKNWTSENVLFTFDDGYQCVFENAYPLLRDAGFVGAVFVVTNYIGKKNNWDINFGLKFSHMNVAQLRELHAEGWIIGSHSHNHLDLTRLPHAKLKNELRISKETLEDIIGDKVFAIAYPYGRYNQRVLEAAAEAGYVVGFGTTKGKKFKGYEYLSLRRRGVYAIDFSIRAKIDSIPFLSGFERIKENLITRASDISALIKSMSQPVF